MQSGHCSLKSFLPSPGSSSLSSVDSGQIEGDRHKDENKHAKGCWKGFSIDAANSNLQLLKKIVKDVREQVVGTNHLQKDIRIEFPNLRIRDREGIAKKYGKHVRNDMETMNLGLNVIIDKFYKSIDLEVMENQEEAIYKFFRKNGVGECGAQAYECLEQLQEAGVPLKDIWPLMFLSELVESEVRSLEEQRALNRHMLVLLAKHDSVEELFTGIAKRAKDLGLEYNRHDYRLKYDPIDLLTELSGKDEMAMVVDPFVDEVILAKDLKKGNSRVFSCIKANKLTQIYSVENLHEKPLQDPDISDLQLSIESDEKALKALKSVQKIAHKAKLRIRISSEASLTKKDKDYIMKSLDSEEFNLALRQCAHGKANSVLDYLLDNRADLPVDINAVGASKRTALMFANKAGNEYAKQRLEKLHERNDKL